MLSGNDDIAVNRVIYSASCKASTVYFDSIILLSASKANGRKKLDLQK
jgi:hypothetical protein